MKKLKKLCANICVFFWFFPLDAQAPIQDREHLQSSYLWHQVRRLQEQGVLDEMINQRRLEIETIKNHWKEKLTNFIPPPEFTDFQTCFQKGTLQRIKEGCGSTYLLLNEQGIPQFVLKPFDEEIFCLNHPKQFFSPYNNRIFRVKDHIPLYRSFQAEALAFQLASILEFSHLTPPTHLEIVSHEQFFDIKDPQGYEKKEKLCSIQVYLPNIQNLYQLVEEWLSQNLSEEQILSLVDQEDFENLVLLIWLLYDTDAHAGNLYAQKDNTGTYHLIKIDNSLTFPEKNAQLLNSLYFFPHTQFPLSERARSLIGELPIESFIEQFTLFEMEDALNAFLERVTLLQQLAKKGSYSIREIDARLRLLECKAALHPLP